MSDNKEQNQQRDAFSQYIGQRLKDHRLPPDESCWDEIGVRMKARRNRIILRRTLLLAGAAAVALLLWIGVPEVEILPPGYIDIVEQPIVSDVITESPVTNPVIAVADVKPQSRNRAQKILEPLITEETNITEPGTPEEIEKVKNIESEKEPQTVSDDQTAGNGKKKSTELPVMNDNQLALLQKTKRVNNWQVSAGLVTNGRTSLGNDKDPDAQHDNPIGDGSGGTWIPTPPGYDGQLKPEDCDDITYNLPLSFGVTVRKQLANKLYIETGLVYTYLSTNLRKTGRDPIDGKLGLHYLGIPVNLIVDLWHNPKWNLYASGGLTVEKGLRSVYTEQYYKDGTEMQAKVKTSIRGVQWSLNGSIGVSYRILKDWSIYAEPRISYFFDNNQPISVRTDKPLTLGFGLGVRYDF